jgi:predicted site-specific integrase-resolvase
MAEAGDEVKLLFPFEVAKRFRVSTDSVTRWGNRGLLTIIWTPGGRRRYREDEVEALLEAGTQPAFKQDDGREG